MRIYQDQPFGALSITDQPGTWFEAQKSMTANSASVAILINTSSEIAQKFVNAWNIHMGWNGDASAKIPAGGISTLKPISAFEITQNLNQGFNYEFVYGEIGPEGTPYGRQGLTEGMRAFLQRAALS